MMFQLAGLLAIAQSGPIAGGQDAPSPRPTPATPVSTWVGKDDYPKSALWAREQGAVAFTLDVGPKGEITGCTVTRSSGSYALDEATCDLMRTRAALLPARDARGNPVAARYSNIFRWELPDNVVELASLPASDGYEAILTLDEKGAVSDCEVVRSLGNMAKEVCGRLTAVAARTPTIILVGGKAAKVKVRAITTMTYETMDAK